MKKIELTELQVSEIIKLYTEDLLGSPTISEKLKIHKTIILNTLRNNGIDLGPSGRRNIGGKKALIKNGEILIKSIYLINLKLGTNKTKNIVKNTLKNTVKKI